MSTAGQQHGLAHRKNPEHRVSAGRQAGGCRARCTAEDGASGIDRHADHERGLVVTHGLVQNGLQRVAPQGLVSRELVHLAVPDELIEDPLGALLALVTTGSRQTPRPDREVLARCQSVIQGRLSKAGLVASEVAQACAISPRTLHRTFRPVAEPLAVC